MAYAFCIAGLFPVDPNTVGAECERLAASSVGLSPTTLLDASRADNAPCHNCFEWQDDKAAELYRLEQARNLIKSIEIVRDEKPAERAFVSVRPNAVHEYVPINAALSRSDWTVSLLERAKQELEAFERKYANLTELSGVFAEIDKLRA